MRSRLAVGAVAVVCLGLAQAPQPAPSPTPTSSAVPTASAPPARPEIALRGTVRGPDRAPVKDALVTARATNARWDEPPATTRTDAAGTFRLVVKGAVPHDLRVEAAPLAPRTLRDVRPGKDLDVTLEPGQVLEGTVRDGTTGRPVAEAKVRAAVEGFAGTEEGGLRGATDTEGRFRLAGAGRGSHLVTATARGFGRAGRAGVRPGKPVELILTPGPTVFGTVRLPDGRPAPAVAVRPDSAIGFRRPDAVATTDREGRFEVDDLSPGVYRLWALHPKWPPASSEELTVGSDGEVEADVVLGRGGRAAGRLVDPEGRPLAGRVSLLEVGGVQVPAAVAEAVRAEAGGDGRFLLTRVPAAPVVLAARAPGRVPARVDVDGEAGGEPVDAGDVVLQPAATIRGRVRDGAGRPVAGAQAEAHARAQVTGVWRDLEATADAEGLFVLDGVQQGARYELLVRAPGFGSVTRRVAGGESVEIVLAPGGRLTGTVVDSSGRPVPDFEVTANPESSGDWTSDTVHDAEDGRFTLEDLAPGTYAVEVSARDHATAAVSGVKLVAGQARDVGRIRLERGGTVRGEVKDASGRPVAGARLSAHQRSDLYRTRTDDPTTDAGGRFEIRGLAAGTAELHARHPRYATGRATVEVVPGAAPAEVQIVLEEGGRVEGSVLRRDGSGAGGMMVRATPSAGLSLAPTGADGRFVLEHLPAGRVTLTVMATVAPGNYRGALSREVEVRDAETTTVDLQLREVLVTGTLSRNGAPLPGMQVAFALARGESVMGSSARMGAPPAGGPALLGGLTGEDGRYSLIVMDPGSYTVRVGSPDGKLTYPQLKAEVPDAEATTVDLEIPALTAVAGFVREKEGGQPVPDASVFAPRTKPPAPGAAVATAGADGAFHMEVEPGAYRIGARAEGFAPTWQDLTVGDTAPPEVVLLLSRATTLRGRVLGPAGPVAGASVSAGSFEGERTVSSFFDQTLADGSFRIADLAPRPHAVLASSTAFGFALLPSVDPASGEVTLTLAPGGRASLRVLGPDGKPAARAFVRLAAVDGVRVSPTPETRGLAGEEGKVELPLPAGRVELIAIVDGGALEGRLTLAVTAGETASGEVTLLPR